MYLAILTFYLLKLQAKKIEEEKIKRESNNMVQLVKEVQQNAARSKDYTLSISCKI